MTSKLLSFFAILSGRYSIRVRMVWGFILSLFLATLLVNLLVYLITQHFYMYGLSPALLVPFPFIASFLCFFALFTHRIVKYVRTLAAGLQSIARGNLNYRLPLSREDELGSVARNINEMTEQLQRQMERERQLEQSKMELISGVSHDLRTPLTSVIGYLNLLKTDAVRDEDDRKRYLDTAYNKSQQLKKLVDDLFEYTRLIDGKAQWHFQQVDLDALLEQIVTEFEPIAAEQGVSVVKEAGPASVIVRTDIEKLVRAIDNMLINALKFSLKPGEVRVRLDDAPEQAVLTFTNRGTPITEEQERLLFERFYKVEPSRSDRGMPAGSGLGLSIAKQIVEMAGGRIGLHHDRGLFGFFIELPKEQPSAEHSRQQGKGGSDAGS